jgi:ureidoglycolate hydrolase
VAEFEVRRVRVQPLDVQAFARYGTVVEPGHVEDPTLNRAPGQMAYLWVHQPLQYPKPPYFATCRYYYRGSRVEYLQQHPESTVFLVPLDGKPSVVMFAPDRDDQPDLDGVEAILLDGHRGLIVNPGVWLRYAYPILETADYAYVSARIEPEDDIRRVYLDRDHGIVLEWYFGAPIGPGVTLSDSGAVLRLPAKEGIELEMAEGGKVVRQGGSS